MDDCIQCIDQVTFKQGPGFNYSSLETLFVPEFQEKDFVEISFPINSPTRNLSECGPLRAYLISLSTVLLSSIHGRTVPEGNLLQFT